MKYLNNFYTGVTSTIPDIGFGVWQSHGEQLINSVCYALEVGYRLIDTAAIYGNEVEVGVALNKSKVDREDIFVTTKLWNDRHTDVENAFNESLNKLNCGYIDLYLIHWPVSGQNKFLSAWTSMIKLLQSGKVKNIGVSNFSIEQIQLLEAETGVLPSVNQLQIHPFNRNKDLTEWLNNKGIISQAWSPLGHGINELFSDENILSIAKVYNKTPAQIILRWLYENKIVPIPKSSSPERIKENIGIFDFALSLRDLQLIDSLNRDFNVGNDPKSFR